MMLLLICMLISSVFGEKKLNKLITLPEKEVAFFIQKYEAYKQLKLAMDVALKELSLRDDTILKYQRIVANNGLLVEAKVKEAKLSQKQKNILLFGVVVSGVVISFGGGFYLGFSLAR